MPIWSVKRARWLVVFALAALSITWVYAFSDVKVSAAGSVTIVNSDAALLGVAPCADGCDANKTGIASLQGTQLVLDFRKGAAGTNYGVQTGATYTFKDLVWITNNAGRSVTIAITPSTSSSDLVYIRDQNGNTLAGSGAGPVTVPVGGQLKLTFRWQGNSPTGTSTPVQLTVSAS